MQYKVLKFFSIRSEKAFWIFGTCHPRLGGGAHLWEGVKKIKMLFAEDAVSIR